MCFNDTTEFANQNHVCGSFPHEKAVGPKAERYHMTEDPTHPALCQRLCSSNGYLLLSSSEAGSVLPESWPNAGKWDKDGINFHRLLGAAQGGAVRRETCRDNEKKKASSRGARDNAEPEQVLKDIEHTNVIIVLLQQVTTFAEWWALQDHGLAPI